MTKQSFKKVIAAFKVLKANPKNDYDGRLLIQKTVCLLQMMGVKFGYKFELNVKGAYSYELAEDMNEYWKLKKLRASEADASLPISKKGNWAKE